MLGTRCRRGAYRTEDNSRRRVRSRLHRKSKRPELSDLRDSGAIEQDADVVMFIDRERKRDEQAAVQEAKIILAKQRNGPTGDIEIMFVPSYSTFANKKEE